MEAGHNGVHGDYATLLVDAEKKLDLGSVTVLNLKTVENLARRTDHRIKRIANVFKKHV